MKTNLKAFNTEKTFEGATARIPNAEIQLLRQVASCFLFEDTFYESGSTIAAEIADSAKRVSPEFLAATAVQARTDFKLRHAPLFLLAQLDKRRAEVPGLVAKTIPQVVLRADELTELPAIIQKEHGGAPLKKVLSAQVKKGLAAAFQKFSSYSLAKYNQEKAIKLRDVLFLTHPKPKDSVQAEVWKKLVDGTLEAPDTWEVALSSGSDKKETWERLLRDQKLGYLALLRNLRNMTQVGVDKTLVIKALMDGAENSKALPFRFVAAARHASDYFDVLSEALLKAVSTEEKLPGTTYVVVDVSGSMDAPLSGKSDLNRIDAASALAVLISEICEKARVYSFSNDIIEVVNFRGLHLANGIGQSQFHSGTDLGGALRKLRKNTPKADRVIVVTDEQSHSEIGPPHADFGYLINVAPYRPALETGKDWTRINGFSERIVDFIRFEEALKAAQV